MSEAPAAAPSPRDVAALLARIGTLMELNGRDGFRARAFANAARALEGVDADLTALAREDRLTSLRGVGTGIASVIREYVLTGASTVHDELQAATPLGLFDLLRVQGLGSKRIHTLHAELGVDGLDALEQAARAGRIAGLPGFGKKTEQKILRGIDFARTSRQQRRYPDALETAVRLLEWLRGLEGVDQAEIAGAIRRRMEVVDSVDLVAAADEPAAVLDAFRRLQGVPDEAEAPADAVTLLLSDGVTARLRCVPPDAFVAAMVWETGSSAHVEALAAIAAARGAIFDAGGFRAAGAEPARFAAESDLYDRLGLAYVPPELREGLGEVGRAAAGPLPPLVEVADLRGTFHCHTTYSDGKATLREMVDAARERGWSYLGLADHSHTASYAGGLTVQRVKEQHREVEALSRSLAGGSRFRIFKGIESDILPDGSLDYPDAVLATFDYVVGSVHSSFGMPGEEMTARVIRAVRHPALTILGHLTGRLLLTRSGYPIDVAAVLVAAAEAGVVIEINANPHRLDLDWRDVREAARLGILIAVNPDAHSVNALDHIAFGVNMARKAGLEPRQVLNTWPLEEVEEYFAARKQGVQA